jgi:hypothetical protein
MLEEIRGCGDDDDDGWGREVWSQRRGGNGPLEGEGKWCFLVLVEYRSIDRTIGAFTENVKVADI